MRVTGKARSYLDGYLDGGSQWAVPAVPQADVDRWLADGSFGSGPEPFRAAMRQHAKGVAIITAGLDEPAGFCATSLSSVSLEPPIVSFTVGLRSSSWPVVRTARLAAGQADLAHRFGQKEVPRFGPQTRWHRDAFGLPVLDDALAWLVVALARHVPVGDHALVIGRVIAARHTAGPAPLIHVDGQFVPLAPALGPPGDQPS